MEQQQHQYAYYDSLNSPAEAGGLRALAAFTEVLKGTDARMGDWDQLRELWRAKCICELHGDGAPSLALGSSYNCNARQSRG